MLRKCLSWKHLFLSLVTISCDTEISGSHSVPDGSPRQKKGGPQIHTFHSLPGPSSTLGSSSFESCLIQCVVLLTSPQPFYLPITPAKRFVFASFCFVFHSEKSNYRYNNKATHVSVWLPSSPLLTVRTNILVSYKNGTFYRWSPHKGWGVRTLLALSV